MIWAGQPLDPATRQAAIDRWLQLVALRTAKRAKGSASERSGPPGLRLPPERSSVLDGAGSQRAPEDVRTVKPRKREPKAVVLGEMAVLFVKHTRDIDLARELMTTQLTGWGVDTADIEELLDEPVALHPWVVGPDRKSQLEGVLFR